MNARFLTHNVRRATRLALFAVLLALACLTPAATPRVTASALPDGLLNPDGTLNLAADFNGALDLRGWQVTLDATRGPVFQPADSPPARPTAAGWYALGTGMNGSVRALAISGTDVYAGGSFTSAGSCASGCNRIAKWNGTTWSALGTGMSSYVFALTISGTDVYAGGEFTSAGSCTSANGCNRIAKWNGTTWSALGTGMNNTVLALAISGSDVYAGGYFTSAGVTSANRIAKWDGTTWSALGTGMNGYVRALAISGTDVYAGGEFTSAGSCASGCNYIARYGEGPTAVTLSSFGATTPTFDLWKWLTQFLGR